MSRSILYKKQIKTIPILSQDILSYKQKVSSKSGIPNLEREDLSNENLNLYGVFKIYNILPMINNTNEIKGVGKLSKKRKAYKSSHLTVYYSKAAHKEVRLRQN